jgi:SNF2 family DNA or RNA helicase
MGTGNVQDRAVALHHLDAPWRPADVAQREGRIIRQGNLNPEVQVIRWITAGSFDAYMWQTLERKARFIHDVTSPSLDARETADVGDTVLTFSEAKALATAIPSSSTKPKPTPT